MLDVPLTMWWPENTEGIQLHQATTGEKANYQFPR